MIIVTRRNRHEVNTRFASSYGIVVSKTQGALEEAEISKELWSAGTQKDGSSTVPNARRDNEDGHTLARNDYTKPA